MAKHIFCIKTIYFCLNYGLEIQQDRHAPKNKDILIDFDQRNNLRLNFFKGTPALESKFKKRYQFSFKTYLYCSGLYICYTRVMTFKFWIAQLISPLTLSHASKGFFLYPGSIPSFVMTFIFIFKLLVCINTFVFMFYTGLCILYFTPIFSLQCTIALQIEDIYEKVCTELKP